MGIQKILVVGATLVVALGNDDKSEDGPNYSIGICKIRKGAPRKKCVGRPYILFRFIV